MTQKSDIDIWRVKPGCIQLPCPLPLKVVSINGLFKKRGITPLIPLPIMKSSVDLKVVSNLVLKQLLDYNAFGDL